MSAHLTPARQRNAVSEGMALGLLLCGRNTVAYDKIGVDLAFEGAWRVWTYRDRFPRVSTDLAKGLDGIWVMTHADEQKQVWVLFWENDRELTICARQSDWDYEDSADLEYAVRMISGDVPAEGWKVLAQEFLDRFER
ncbi:hypothetical protein [Nocardia vinacea]|uniref:hypothetical protein n=1 Tax=Nocardia vinacea TaxID=96468 RepID=UPI0005947A1B|nr:hypothetical protein [Nocardia vinacea]